ncbi:MAG: hypothetical protein GY820_23505 [Gammaproteobacteria bacterium]|nr:hypothetical protein [Gammaproteobacteria bacterium]
MRFLAILFSFFLASCSFADKRVTDHAVLYYNDLSLISKNGTCVLYSTASSKTTKFTLKLKPPCYFVRYSRNDKLKQFSYPRLGADFVVIMFGNPLSDEKRKVWNLEDDDICGSVAQGMVILNNNVRISKRILEGGLSCTHGGHDEKDYWYFAKHS